MAKFARIPGAKNLGSVDTQIDIELDAIASLGIGLQSAAQRDG